ncbi:GntR family transcriptional regulator [Jidongwangia harbinensis]|uniref:GntR family transcriptional regulator n=1 Tax=Jidongwangia harbinensis TaxID=2878561 RepID=UPI001CDA37A5|nr:GntR family transcriptional regulator [Jidongwangia harbinensis]MCA2215068.1 GntR family transcriptional regulator [Jidongwangia harbinensis]
MAANGDRREPKYATIAADLEARIHAGDYRPGQALPGQRELSAAYGVTLMTLRQALTLLSDRGLVTQQPGRGTFVAGPKAAYTMGSLRSLSDDLRDQGHVVDTVVLAVADDPLPEPVADRLGLAAGARGVRVERLRRLGTTPAIHQESWIPEPYARGPAGANLAVTSLYRALTDAGVGVARAEERLSPGLLEQRLSALLNQPAGVPVFRSERTTFDGGDVPVVFDRATILGDLIEIRTVRAASSMSMRWINASAPDGVRG